jgi:hypothetical protein
LTHVWQIDSYALVLGAGHLPSESGANRF